MIRDDEHWLTLTDAFQEAALDGSAWYDALTAFAQATGSQHGQLVCMGEDATMPLNLLTNVDPALPAAFVAAGGTDPRVNPRRRAGLARPPLTIIAESDFISPDECKQDAHYQEFAIPWDVPYICLTTLERRPGLLVGLATIRTDRQGHIDAEGRRVFASIAPHVRGAVRTSLALGEHGDALLSDALESVAIPAFICDQTGTVRRLTPAAEALVSGDCGLQLKGGRLIAQHSSEANALADAIRASAAERRVGAPSTHVVIVRGGERGVAPLVLDVLALPGPRLPFAFDARVLVLARGRGTGGSPRRAAVLQSVYGLTAAETEIALQILAGKSAESIADGRGVSVGTVRAQIKVLLAKAGVNRQLEFVAQLSHI
jgi:DNA-binding CsgD family transcriptional regulator